VQATPESKLQTDKANNREAVAVLNALVNAGDATAIAKQKDAREAQNATQARLVATPQGRAGACACACVLTAYYARSTVREMQACIIPS
jgi:hypothetical protein